MYIMFTKPEDLFNTLHHA